MYIYLYVYIYIYVYAIPSFFSQGGETGSSICGKTGNDLRFCFLVKFETHWDWHDVHVGQIEVEVPQIVYEEMAGGTTGHLIEEITLHLGSSFWGENCWSSYRRSEGGDQTSFQTRGPGLQVFKLLAVTLGIFCIHPTSFSLKLLSC